MELTTKGALALYAFVTSIILGDLVKLALASGLIAAIARFRTRAA
ncbi:hypothetical protein [Rhodovulum sulfidophilum]|nr:hypothetical protein [Rhodovulum sulfidophilum]